MNPVLLLKNSAIHLIYIALLLNCGERQGSHAENESPGVPEAQTVEMVDLLMWEWDRGNVHEIYAADMTDGLASRFTCARGWDRMPASNKDGTHIYFLSDRGIYDGVQGRRLYRKSFDNRPASEVILGSKAKPNFDAFAVSPDEDLVAQVLDGDYPETSVFERSTGALLYKRKGCWAPSFSNDSAMLTMSCIPVLRDRRDPWDPVRAEVVEARTGNSLYGSAGWSLPADPEKAKAQAKSGEDGATYNSPRFSPDGTKLAYSYYQPGSVEKPQIHIRDLKGRSTLTLTSDDSPCLNPTWSPDGQSIFYLSYSKEQTEIRRIPSGGGVSKTFGAKGGKIRNLAQASVPLATYQKWHPCAALPDEANQIVLEEIINQDPETHISEEEPAIAHKLRARFEYQLSLAGFELKRLEPTPLHLTLLAKILFEVHSRPPGNFEVGLELKSKDHTITKKFAPLPGESPPYMWKQGSWIMGEYLFPVGYDIPPGTYFMTMWLYSPRGNIPIMQSDGHLHTSENRMPLGSIILK